MSITAANRECLHRMQEATPCLVDLRPAAEVVPGMTDRLILHSGPPLPWERMCGPMRGAVIGACLFEGWARTPAEVGRLAGEGQIRFDPCHHHDAVGPMAGIITRSMHVFVVRNERAGNEAYATINMGLGKVLRMGAYDDSVLARLHWMNGELAAVLRDAIGRAGPLDVKTLLAQALTMGDEAHNRYRAATSLLIRSLAPKVATSRLGDVERALTFMGASDSFCLNIGMAACKATLDAASGIPGATLVTALARNGTEFGIRVSGLGPRWFTAPAPAVEGVYFPGYGPGDANLDIGDSAITETAGLGAFAMAAAPAIVQLVGGSPALAREITERMYEITAGEHETFRIPALDFRGTPLGIDVRKVVQTGIEPVIDTGIAHREAGVGQIGAGLTVAPMACFLGALGALAGQAAATPAGPPAAPHIPR
jgi:hypothetical protein